MNPMRKTFEFVAATQNRKKMQTSIEEEQAVENAKMESKMEAKKNVF